MRTKKAVLWNKKFHGTAFLTFHACGAGATLDGTEKGEVCLCERNGKKREKQEESLCRRR